MRALLALAFALVLGSDLAAAEGITVLTVGKLARFQGGAGMIRVGRDSQLASPPAPTCPATSAVELSSHPEPTQRVVVATAVDLDCARWKAKRGRFVYDDPAATGGVRKITYGRKGLVITFEGGGFTAPVGPLGYLQAWLTVGGTRFNTRVHNWKRNQLGLLVSRKPSNDAARGERAFWSVLHGDWASGAEKADLETTALDCLRKAAKRDTADGWSRFLLAMMHLYRFAQRVESYANVSDPARTEIEAARDAFQQALPLLWDGTKGDSRVPGFAAAATFVLGLVRNDPGLQAQGMAELDAAFGVNLFFNVFDYIPVAQAVPAFDPRFLQVFEKVNGYLNDPDTLACIATQPEICNNGGYAPRNTAGSLALFGDLYAKAGDLSGAQRWYGLGLSLASAGSPPYRFLPALQLRVATVNERLALFRDADPANDPTVIGAGAEACAACHTR